MTKLRKSIALFAAACLLSSPHAIEKFSVVPLLDDGFGSKAAYVFGAPNMQVVVGQKSDALGRSLPMVWEYDRATGGVTATQLPMPAGTQGECVGGGTFPSGDRVVVGNISDDTAHVWGSSFWVSRAGGPWSMHPLSPPNRAARMAAAVYNPTGEPNILTAGWMENGGLRRPVAILLTSDLEAEARFLPAPAGFRGEIVSIEPEYYSGPPTTLFGQLEGPNNRTRWVVWDEDSGSGDSVLDVPRNQSYVDAWISRNFIGVCGTAVQNGRTRGIWVPQGSPVITLPPLDGYANSSAARISGPNAVIFGQSSNSTSDAVATLFLPLPAGNYRPTPVQGLADAHSPRITLFAGVAQVGLGVVGGLVPGGAILSSAALFVANGRHVPDNLTAATGAKINGELHDLWNDDGQELSFRTHQGRAAVELGFTPLSFSAGQDARMDSFVRTPTQVTGGVINVYLLNPASGEFELVTSAAATGGRQSVSWDTNQMSRWQNQETGAVRMRLEFLLKGKGPSAVAIESIELAHEG